MSVGKTLHTTSTSSHNYVRLWRAEPECRRESRSPLLIDEASTPRLIVASWVTCVVSQHLDLTEFE